MAKSDLFFGLKPTLDLIQPRWAKGLKNVGYWVGLIGSGWPSGPNLGRNGWVHLAALPRADEEINYFFC